MEFIHHRAAAALEAEEVIRPTGRGSDCAERCPLYALTPVAPLEDLASAHGLGAVLAKDERRRFGLPSFKALGAAHAVLTLAAEGEAGSKEASTLSRLIRSAAGGARLGRTFAAATAGNHGRAVAAAARLVGAEAVIFVYPGVHPALVAAIRREGARVIVTPGTYDDAVDVCRRHADNEGWTIVSDTAWPGYEDSPKRVMEGYGAIARELAETGPTHLFVQAGVGSLAAGVAAALPLQTRIVVVEPKLAAPLFASVRAGALTTAPRRAPTNMGRLECYEASPLAWRILERRATAFMTIEDEDAAAAAKILGSRGLATSPTGAAGLAGLLAILDDANSAGALELGPTSRIVVLVTEPAAPETQGDIP